MLFHKYFIYSQPNPINKVFQKSLKMKFNLVDFQGLKTEIIPLTRPFGVYAGNVFQGVVKVNGKPVPFTEVEVEYFNEDGKYSAAKGPFVTQVVKCDQDGVFTYALPKAGWWGFAALNEDDVTIKFGEEEKPIEIGAVLWIQAYNMR